jgi:hypothetical protein
MMTTYIAICHTDGCFNEGIPIPIETPDGDPAPNVGCGPCGLGVTDVTVQGE